MAVSKALVLQLLGDELGADELRQSIESAKGEILRSPSDPEGLLLRFPIVDLHGIQFYLWDPREGSSSDLLSFVFLRIPEIQALDGQIVEVHRDTSSFRNPLIAAADVVFEYPSIHLRYYLEDWFDSIMAWVKAFFVPNLHYWRHEEFGGEALLRRRLRLHELYSDLSISEIEQMLFSEILDRFVWEAEAWARSCGGKAESDLQAEPTECEGDRYRFRAEVLSQRGDLQKARVARRAASLNYLRRFQKPISPDSTFRLRAAAQIQLCGLEAALMNRPNDAVADLVESVILAGGDPRMAAVNFLSLAMIELNRQRLIKSFEHLLEAGETASILEPRRKAWDFLSIFIPLYRQVFMNTLAAISRIEEGTEQALNLVDEGGAHYNIGLAVITEIEIHRFQEIVTSNEVEDVSENLKLSLNLLLRCIESKKSNAIFETFFGENDPGRELLSIDDSRERLKCCLAGLSSKQRNSLGIKSRELIIRVIGGNSSGQVN